MKPIIKFVGFVSDIDTIDDIEIMAKVFILEKRIMNLVKNYDFSEKIKKLKPKKDCVIKIIETLVNKNFKIMTVRGFG